MNDAIKTPATRPPTPALPSRSPRRCSPPSGRGEIAYVRAIKSDDLNRLFPQAPEIQPGLDLFALLGADGTPIMVTDSRNTAIANAWEHNLVPVSVH